MNYFAHALPLLDESPPDPYRLAGIAVPDWLGVTSKKTKCRTRHAEPFYDHSDPRLVSLARGVAQHHADDKWFHETRAFTELSLDFSKQLRMTFGDASGMRPWFLGHILVELLLDDALIADAPERLDEYYAAVAQADAEFVAQSIETMCDRPVGDLEWFIGRYVEVRFLADYADDERLRYRLNQVMRRVGLAEIPVEFLSLLPDMRRAVADRRIELVDRNQHAEPHMQSRPSGSVRFD